MKFKTFTCSIMYKLISGIGKPGPGTWMRQQSNISKLR